MKGALSRARSWTFINVAMLAYSIAPGPEMLGRHGDITIMIVISKMLFPLQRPIQLQQTLLSSSRITYGETQLMVRLIAPWK